MKAFYFILLFISTLLCNAKSTSMELVLERPIEFSGEYGDIIYTKDAGNGKIILVTYLFNGNHQHIPWIYDSKKDTIYSMGINNDILSCNVNGFFSTLYGSTIPVVNNLNQDLDVFAVRNGKIYFNGLRQGDASDNLDYLFESNGEPNGTRVVCSIPSRVCSPSYGLLYNSVEALYYLVEPFDCYREDFTIYKLNTDTLIPLLVGTGNEVIDGRYYTYHANQNNFFVAYKDKVVNLPLNGSEQLIVLDSLDNFLNDKKIDGTFVSQILSIGDTTYLLQNGSHLDCYFNTPFGDFCMGPKDVYFSNIWKTDGTQEGTTLMMQIPVNPSLNRNTRIMESQGRIYFAGVLENESRYSIFDITQAQLTKVLTVNDSGLNPLKVGLTNNYTYSPSGDITKFAQPIFSYQEKDYFILYKDLNADIYAIDKNGAFELVIQNLPVNSIYEFEGEIYQLANIFDFSFYENKLFLLMIDSLYLPKFLEINVSNKTIREIGNNLESIPYNNSNYQYLIENTESVFFVGYKKNIEGNSGIWKISDCSTTASPEIISEVIGDNVVKYSIVNPSDDEYIWNVEKGHIISSNNNEIYINWTDATRGSISVYAESISDDSQCDSEVTNVNYNNSQNDTDVFKLLVYPNPSNNLLQLISNKELLGNIMIYDLLGKSVKTTPINGKNTLIDISNLSAGTYSLVFSENRLASSIMFVVVK